MALVQMFPQIVRTGRQVSGTQTIPATAFRTWEIMSDLSATDMADPNLFIYMGIDVADVTDPSGWRVEGGGFVRFQCGPVTNKDGTVNNAGANRGFQVNASVLAGKDVRGVLELRSGSYTGPFRSATIGITRQDI
jgi:hypothetical protein